MLFRKDFFGVLKLFFVVEIALLHDLDNFLTFVQISRKVLVKNTLRSVVIQDDFVLHLEELVRFDALALPVYADFVPILHGDLICELLELLFPLSARLLFLFLLLAVKLILVLQV